MTKAQQKIVDAVQSSIDDLENLITDLEETFDEKVSKSEKWPDSEKGEEAQAEIDGLQTYLDDLQAAAAPDAS